LRAEVNSHQFGLHSLGGAAFQATAQRVHRLLFDEPQAPGSVAADARQLAQRPAPLPGLLPFRVAV
jgi:NitT/TauT family transport system ATP-binding protein